MCAGAPKWPSTCKLQHFKISPASLVEAETRDCFVTERYVIILRTTLEELVHLQTITQLFTDNKTVPGISKDTIKQHNEYAVFLDSWSKNVKNFLIAWKAGQKNVDDYKKKHHSANHDKLVRPIHLWKNKTPRSVPLVLLKLSLQECVNPVDSNMK